MVPADVLFEISSVLLSGPKFEGAHCEPMAGSAVPPCERCLTKVPSSPKISMKPPVPPDELANET